MKNLLNSTDIATLFLDGELRVRRFTTPTSKIIKLIPADVGRSITDIASDLDYTDLADDAREVLSTLVFKERSASTKDGRWFAVKIMPYRTLDNVIEGVVITFTDAKVSKHLERALEEQSIQFRQLAETLPNFVWGCRTDGSCDYFSPQWRAYTGVTEGDQLRFGWLEHVHPDDRERVRERWTLAIKESRRLDAEFRLRRADGVFHWFSTRWIPICDTRGRVLRWYASSLDIEELRRLRAAVATVDEAVVVLERDQVAVVNPAASKLLGDDSVGKSVFDLLPEARGNLGAASFPAHRGGRTLNVHVHPQRDAEAIVLVVET